MNIISFKKANLLIFILLLFSVQYLFAYDDEEENYSFKSKDFSIGFGFNFPTVKDKFYIAPEIDIAYKNFGGYFDIGLMYSNKEIKEFKDKNFLGFFTDFEFFLKTQPLENLPLFVKPGIGISYHNLANIDKYKDYVMLPASVTFEYVTINNVKFFYKMQYILTKPNDIKFGTTNIVNSIGIGVNF